MRHAATVTCPGWRALLYAWPRPCVRLNQLEEAGSRYREALATYTAAGDLSGEADVYLGLSALAGDQHRFADALGYSRRALGTSRRAGDRRGQALALNSIGWDHTTLGDYHQAVTSCREALALMQELGLREGEACHLGQPGLRPPGASRLPAGRDLLPACSRSVPRTR